MAVASTINEGALGSLRLNVVFMSAVSAGDTWNSGMQGVVGYHYQEHGSVVTGTSVALSGSTFTFYNDGVQNGEGELFIYSKQ